MRYGWICSVLFGLSLIQCSSNETKGPKYPDTASFCEGMAAAECSGAVLSACLATSDKQNCLAVRDTACMATYVTPSVGLTYDPAKAEACVNTVSAAYANSAIPASQFSKIAAACGAVFSGTGTKGTTCEVNTDCKQSDNLACVIHAGAADAGSSAEGTCQVPVTVAAGESCSAVEDLCDADHYCDPGMHCVAAGVANDNCSASVPCKAQFRCTNGKCVAKLAEGTSCNSADQCSSGLCLDVENGRLCANQQTLAPSEPFCVAIRGQSDGG